MYLPRPQEADAIMTPILLEIAAGSVGDCCTAAQAGAHRVELNSGLQLGGLTPSLGAVKEAIERIDIPVIAMVRPRPGGFCYDRIEQETMRRDADLLLEAGSSGLAFGFLHEDGRIDVDACGRFLDHCSGAETVFHRAFDLTPDPAAALETLIELGVSRVLTSGGKASAYAGHTQIARLVTQAGDRIEILPGGGIRRANVDAILTRTGCRQIHASLSALAVDPTGGLRQDLSFNAERLYDDRYPCTSSAAVVEMRAYLDQRAAWSGR